jgi:hypothetical protein
VIDASADRRVDEKPVSPLEFLGLGAHSISEIDSPLIDKQFLEAECHR